MGGGNPSKKLINGVLINGGGQKSAKNGFLGYLLETSAFYILRTVYALYAHVGFLRYLLATSAFYMLRTVYAVYAYVGFLRYLLETSAFYMLRTVYAVYALSFEQNFV